MEVFEVQTDMISRSGRVVRGCYFHLRLPSSFSIGELP